MNKKSFIVNNDFINYFNNGNIKKLKNHIKEIWKHIQNLGEGDEYVNYFLQFILWDMQEVLKNRTKEKND